MNQEEIRNKFWSQIILILGLFAFLIGLGAVSVVSFFQTYKAFEPMNDPSMYIFGFNIGAYIAVSMALCVQYGQQAALFIAKFLCKNETILNIGTFKLKDKNLAMTLFWVTAVADAMSNIVWFNSTVGSAGEPITDVILKLVGYAAMIFSIFAEEALGIVMDAFSKALKQLTSIMEYNRRVGERERKNDVREQNSSQPEKKIQNQQKPTFNNQPKQNQQSGQLRPQYQPTMSANRENQSRQNRPMPEYRPEYDERKRLMKESRNDDIRPIEPMEFRPQNYGYGGND